MHITSCYIGPRFSGAQLYVKSDILRFSEKQIFIVFFTSDQWIHDIRSLISCGHMHLKFKVLVPDNLRSNQLDIESLVPYRSRTYGLLHYMAYLLEFLLNVLSLVAHVFFRFLHRAQQSYGRVPWKCAGEKWGNLHWWYGLFSLSSEQQPPIISFCIHQFYL